MESIIKETELKYEKDALIDSNRGGNHTNRDALIQGIKYISRTRKNEDRANELVAYGATGISSDPELGYQEMLFTQKQYKINARKGKRVEHHIFGLGYEDKNERKLSDEQLTQFAKECSEEYYKMGFQNCYALHREPSGEMHIHFMINSIQFTTGLKFHEHWKARRERSYRFSDNLEAMRHKEYPTVPVCPIIFYDNSGRRLKNE